MGIEPVAFVRGQVSDLRELLIGFFDKRPINFTHWNVAGIVITASAIHVWLRHFRSSHEYRLA